MTSKHRNFVSDLVSGCAYRGNHIAPWGTFHHAFQRNADGVSRTRIRDSRLRGIGL